MQIYKQTIVNKFAFSALAIAVAFTFSCAQNPDNEQAQTQPEEQAEYVTSDLVSQPAIAEVMVKRDASAQSANKMRAEVASFHADMGHQGFPPPDIAVMPQPNTEKYQGLEENAVKLVAKSPVSTFSVDVDTGSYTNTRRMLNQGYLPPKHAVRVEEFINYFDYQYPGPNDIEHPFSINTDIATAPWNDQRHLIRIGLQGYKGEVIDKRKNLVFLIDVSGSMDQANKLPLLKRSLTMLSHQLTAEDKVSIVVYAGASGVVLEPTDANNTAKITAALEQLSAGGSTNGASGIELAYQMAEQAFVKDGVNRVMLATDGDFNVGMVNHDALIELIEKKRDKGIALTTLGFGAGNYNDYLMEQLADAGNGNYAYIDTINEARKVLVDELSATMQIIAKDVKVQVEFNPNQVAEYRLIGYENRVLKNEDFNNDKVDAGDIGAGHSVTALYEITLNDSKSKFNDNLRYGAPQQGDDAQGNVKSDEIAHVKLRYKMPNKDTSQLIERVVQKADIEGFEAQSSDFQFATAVASFAQLMKDSSYTGEIGYDWIIETANANKGQDTFGYRSEFIQLARTASTLNFDAESSSEIRGMSGR